MATGDLTDLASVNAWIPVTSSDDDTLLATLITSASTFVQSWLNRTIASTSYSETRNGQGMQSMAMANFPISAVSSLSVDGIVVPPRPPLGPGTYATIGGYTFDSGAIYLSGRYSFCRGYQNVQVTYVAGYAATPADVQQATNIIVADWYKNARGQRLGVSGMTIEAQTISFAQSQIPARALLILQQYKRVAPIQ